MTATVRVYKSTDTSAPTLTGQVGSLVALLDACLVNGYGSSTAAGWTKPYTATNKAVFYMGAGTPRMYIDVDDTGTQESRLVGYESMSAVATGTGPFPTAAQLSGGIFYRKSSTADATARPWLLVACERAFYLFSGPAQTTYGATASSDVGLGFGVFPSYKSGDAFNCFINGQVATGASLSRLGTITHICNGTDTFTATTGIFVSRAYTQIGTAITASKIVPGSVSSAALSGAMGTYGGAYPDPITGGFRLARCLICEADGGGKTIERGYMPGFWGVMHNLPANYFDTFGGSGALAGKSFILPPLNAYVSSATPSRGAMEYAGSWDL